MKGLEDALLSDLRLLQDVFKLHKIHSEHPIRTWWDARIRGSRFHLQHLADDLREVQDTKGARSLIRQLQNNPVGFSDFRFELHLAGALARSRGQKLLALGGDKAGPDIEVQVRTGQRCGIACFRPASNAPSIIQLGKDLRNLIGQLKTTVIARSSVSQTIVLDFKEFPLQPHHAEAARGALRKFLTETGKGELDAEGCQLFRLGPPPIDPTRQLKTVRLRLQVPVPRWEKGRVDRTLTEKIAREAASWASAYDGIPIIAIEESAFGQDLSDTLKGLVTGDNPFVGALATYLTVRPDDAGTPHGLEDIAFAFRPTNTDINVGIETFGDNVDSWSRGHAVAVQTPASIREEWDVVVGASGAVVMQVRPAYLDRTYARVPYTDPSKPSADEATIQRLSDAVMSLLEWQNRVQ